jgi:hypothetical protein
MNVRRTSPAETQVLFCCLSVPIIFLEERRPSLDHYAFLRLAAIVNTTAAMRTITTNGIMPNSGMGACGVSIRAKTARLVVSIFVLWSCALRSESYPDFSPEYAGD